MQDETPLEPSQIFEDIAADYVKKTVSIEPHPHLDLRLAYIHPCRHAEAPNRLVHSFVLIWYAQVMKRFIDVIKSHGNTITPEMYSL